MKGLEYLFASLITSADFGTECGKCLFLCSC
jgi:hypothetical protein